MIFSNLGQGAAASKKILVNAAILSAIFSAAVAREPDPLLTRPGWELAAQASGYSYLEPDFAKLRGNRLGIVATGTLTSPEGVFSRFDFRQSYGRLKYEGSGTQSDVPDLILEARVVAGLDWLGGSFSLSPHLGLGYRYLYSDSRGYTSTGAIGYRRESNYLYAPLGLTARFRLGNRWVLAPMLEADILVRGRQASKLTDAGLGLMDITNEQKEGRGHRASLMLEKDHWAVGAWTQYWHIDNSDFQCATAVVNGLCFGGREPENYTRETGLELRYRF
jgi:hypothetical protein